MNFCRRCGYRINGAAVCENCGAFSGAEVSPVAASEVPSLNPSLGSLTQAAAYPLAQVAEPPVPEHRQATPGYVSAQPGVYAPPPVAVQQQSPFVAQAQALPGGTWGFAVLQGLVGFGVGLVVALVAALFLLTAVGVFSQYYYPFLSYAGFDNSTFIFLGIQFVNMAFFGALGVSDLGGIFLVPIFVLAAVLAGVFVSARTFLSVGSIQHRGVRMMVSVVPGLVVATLSTVFAALFPVPLGYYSSAGSLGSASFLSFVVALVFTSGIAFVANGPKAGITAASARRGFPAFGEQLVAATRSVLGYLGLLGLVGLVGLTVAVLVNTPTSFGAAALSFLTVGPHAALWTASMISLSAISATTGSTTGVSQLVSVFSGQPWLGLLGVLFLIAGLAFAGLILFSARRGTVPHRISWAITPAVFIVAGLAIQLFTTISGTGVLGTAGPAGWTFLLFGLWGAIVEVLAQFVLPIFIRNPMTGISGWLGRFVPAATAQSSVRVPVSYPQPTQGYGRPYAAPQPQGQPAATTPYVQPQSFANPVAPNSYDQSAPSSVVPASGYPQPVPPAPPVVGAPPAPPAPPLPSAAGAQPEHPHQPDLPQ